jgi:hypothetical protein
VGLSFVCKILLCPKVSSFIPISASCKFQLGILAISLPVVKFLRVTVKIPDCG